MGKRVYTFSNNTSVAPILNGVGLRFKDAEQLIALIKSDKYSPHAPLREKFILKSYIPEEWPEKIISKKIESLGFSSFGKYNPIYLRIMSSLLWFYYLRFDRKAMLQKFRTIEIQDYILDKKLKKIVNFIYK